MATQLLLIDSLEVSWQALCLHGVHNRGALLHALRRVGLLKAEVFECLAVSRCELEVLRDVAAQPTNNRLAHLAFYTYLRELEFLF